MPNYHELEAHHLREPLSQPAHDEEQEEEPVQEYSPLDSLIYLTRAIPDSLDAVVDLIYEGEEVDTLPENLNDAISLLNSICGSIRKEAEHHGVVHAPHYSNKVPTSVRFNDAPVIDPDGETYMPESRADVHPSGVVHVFSIPTIKEF